MSDSSRKPVLIERYPPSKYANSFVGGGGFAGGGDLFISPPSHHSGSSLSDQADSGHYQHHNNHHNHHNHHNNQHHHNHLARSLSMPGQESDGCHTSYTSCSVHGTLRYTLQSTLGWSVEIFFDRTEQGK